MARSTVFGLAVHRSIVHGLAVAGLMAGWMLLGSQALGQGTGQQPGYCAGNGPYAGQSVGGFNQFWHRCSVDFYRNNTWPEPFLTADKMALRTPYCIETDNGWKLQNTIGTYLFDNDTQRVNQAGELLVKWIVTQAPSTRRAVFVLKGDTAEATNARLQSVQAAVAKYADGCVYPVLLTTTEPAGWAASYIDTITQQYNASIPSPRLPPRQVSGSGQGGSGQGGDGGGGVQ
jgi:hypothetical protein